MRSFLNSSLFAFFAIALAVFVALLAGPMPGICAYLAANGVAILASPVARTFGARAIRDAALTANIALPNANATTFSTFIDLGQTTADCINEGIDLAANVPAIANLANTKTITISVEDADANANANAASLSLVGSFDITGGASGSAAVTKNFKLPGVTRRFVRLKAVGGGNAGTTITETATAEIRV